MWGKPNDTIDSPADVALTQHFRKTEFVRGIETDGRSATVVAEVEWETLVCSAWAGVLCRESWVWAAGGFCVRLNKKKLC